MAVISYPFESLNTGTPSEPVYDRAITAEDERLFNRLRYTNGVFAEVADGLKVSANGNMSITVGIGGGNIEGALFYNTAPLTLALDAADATLNRIDRVVAQFNTSVSVRAVSIAVRTGVSATNPVAPELRREPNFYEIALADISVKKGVTSISTSAIKDQRLNSDLCGMVIVAIPTPIDTSDLWSQYEASLNEWLDTVASALDGTLAGNLQNQIAGLGESIAGINNRLAAEESKIQPISKGGTGAKTAAEARNKLGLGNTIGLDLLWENVAPTSTFTAQTIAVNMSNYNGIMLVARNGATAPMLTSLMVPRARNGNVLRTAVPGGVTAFRDFTVYGDGSGINFGEGREIPSYGTSATTNNTRCIPVEIYGIIGEVE